MARYVIFETETWTAVGRAASRLGIRRQVAGEAATSSFAERFARSDVRLEPTTDDEAVLWVWLPGEYAPRFVAVPEGHPDIVETWAGRR